ncbi:MAG: inorganic pyrophosphatase [Gracilimonas sp.]|uniref:inorganic pyrophosphatase n=1 Tax=Gracilimonas TaxID=649462 RepID=UPI001B12E912|nr:inorganic pyrophosphatase [Gracilimonas sp.]MBO6587047.1 inorganic pyrophosphatase [Gracilimonas sp.]MBO6614465.1 inorganic pyrophosphatase [Gracilimonas sp.]
MNFPNPFFRWRPHPWHGLEVGEDQPKIVNAFIELTPFDTIKYEVDKKTGYMRVDRPQRSSSLPPSLYGFIPRTYCGNHVGELSKDDVKGDGDPLDICVLSERPIDRNEVILSARVIGGLHMVDHDEADDKIISVLDNDTYYSNINSVNDLPPVLIERLRHYFGTYKLIPGKNQNDVYVQGIFDADHAYNVIEASIKDYEEMFGE